MEGQDKKELDLIDIIRLCFDYARKFLFKIGDVCTWFVRFLFQAKWILLVAVVCGIAVAFYVSRPSNLRYKGEVEMRFNIYDAYFYRNLTNFLDTYARNKDKTALAQTLQITPKEAASLLSINSHFFIDTHLTGVPDRVDYAEKSVIKKDTADRRMKDRLMLVVISKDTTVYSNLLEKIGAFFENNKAVSEENEMRLRQIDEKIKMLSNEILLLDSLRKKEYFKKDGSAQAKLDQTILLSEKERRLYHNDILDLEYTIQRLQKEKETRSSGVRFLTPFKIDPNPVNNVRKSLFKFVPVFFVLGFFVALGWKYRKKAYQFLSEKE